MPTFDIVSKTDLAEVDNAINGSMREISARYDFKNSISSISRESDEITLLAEDNYKIGQLQQILRTHFVKRKLESSALLFSTAETSSYPSPLRSELIPINAPGENLHIVML